MKTTPEQRAECERLRDYYISMDGDGAYPFANASVQFAAALMADLEEAERAYDTTHEVWRLTELENQSLKADLAATRRQLAEAQAWKAEAAGCFQAANDEGLQDRLAESVFTYGDGSLADLVSRRLSYACPPVEADATALSATIAEAVEPYKRDAEAIALLATGEWELMKMEPSECFSEETNRRSAWSVKRQRAPYREESGVGAWFGSTPLEAFRKAQTALRIDAALSAKEQSNG